MSTPTPPAPPAPSSPPSPGVSWTPPPGEFMASVNRQIGLALEGLQGEEWLTAVVDVRTEAGINAAVVAKLGDHWAAMAWAGKKWGAPVEGGASIRVAF